ncbi:exodeoxyribonuclease VII small subunit [Muribaculum intestinale]|uniref:exodeoxyribonuclease VII small subunit n=1 Tax=Muribaculum intestinale TaxID=1796646 RepID=UPI000F468CF8|nr:exodeoxyribonuclease VII small subunit [Muribaculum intestinale]ROT10999.1 exodeoxyribonuclease VII small subunit [Muribaculaceae bacterium Isolate-100 (HZI)]RXE65750.1 exodeoxyribonuclease VII small subunit [Muribaculaceae bacterium Isolate-007 (NCI)]
MVPKFTPVADMTYTQAVAEIEEILRMMQADSLDIDLLATYTRRATELLSECRRRLTDTDRELQSILNPQQ